MGIDSKWIDREGYADTHIDDFISRVLYFKIREIG
jgi:hypothetical protein